MQDKTVQPDDSLGTIAVSVSDSHDFPREIIRISRMGDGKLSVVITGELYAAAREFWDALHTISFSSEGDMLTISQ